MTPRTRLLVGSAVTSLVVSGCTHSWVISGAGPAPKVSVRSVDTAQQLTVALQRPAYVFVYRWEGGRLRPAFVSDAGLESRGPASLYRFAMATASPVASTPAPAAPVQRLVYYCPSGIFDDRGIEVRGKGCGWFLWSQGGHPAFWPGSALEASSGTIASGGRGLRAYLIVTDRDIPPAELENAASSVDLRGDAAATGRALAAGLFGPEGAPSWTVVYVAFP